MLFFIKNMLIFITLQGDSLQMFSIKMQDTTSLYLDFDVIAEFVVI